MSTATHNHNRTLLGALRVYLHPRVIGMFFLGFSAGLPLLLVGGTFSAWLRDLGVDLAAIGFLSWVGIAHSIKVFWAPVVDRLPIPFFSKIFGRRRSWMLLAQAMIMVGILGMSLTDPKESLSLIAIWAVLTAFGSATQDIAIDAYRVEAVGRNLQGAMAATYVSGYRVALLCAGAGALHLAAFGSWSLAYGVMTGLVLIGVITTLVIKEPEVEISNDTTSMEERVVQYLSHTSHTGLHRDIVAWFLGAVVCPFADFFRRFGVFSIVILVFLGTFRLSDIVMGVMANPFYLDLGFTKEQIANVAAAFGLAMTLTGAALGGLFIARFGIMRLLIFTAIMAPATNLTFSWLAYIGPETWGLVMAIIADNVTGGIAISVLIAYMSSLTNTAYTATQYALFSSLMTLPGQFIGGFTGMLAEAVDWFWFFIIAAAMGIPAIILALVLARYANPDLIERPGIT